MSYEDVKRGAGVTEFAFRTAEEAVDTTGVDGGTAAEPALESITVKVEEENGALEFILSKDGINANTRGTEVRTVTSKQSVVRSIKE